MGLYIFNILFYAFLAVLCTIFLVLSALALVVCYPFDRSRRVVHELSRILSRIFWSIPAWRKRIAGIENVDKKQAYVIVVNHSAMIDIPMLYYVPLNFRWVSKREVFRIPFFGQFLHLHGDIAIDRGASAAMKKVIDGGKKWIGRGASVAIFPEGTRSKIGEIQRFKSGAFELAKQAGVPILPVVLHGTNTLNKGWRMKFRHTFWLSAMPPVSAEVVANTDIKELAELVREQMIAEKSRLAEQARTAQR